MNEDGETDFISMGVTTPKLETDTQYILYVNDVGYSFMIERWGVAYEGAFDDSNFTGGITFHFSTVPYEVKFYWFEPNTTYSIRIERAE